MTLLTVLHLLLTVTQSLLLASILTSTVYHLLLTLTQFKRLLQTVTQSLHLVLTAITILAPITISERLCLY